MGELRRRVRVSASLRASSAVIACLQITYEPTGMVRDAHSCPRCVRLRPLPIGVVATGTGYRKVHRLLQFVESRRRSLLRYEPRPAKTGKMEPP